MGGTRCERRSASSAPGRRGSCCRPAAAGGHLLRSFWRIAAAPMSSSGSAPGLIEQWANDLLIEIGVGERLQREGMFHDGIHISARRAAAPHRLPQAGRQGRHHLRPAGGGEGSHCQAPRRRRQQILFEAERRERARHRHDRAGASGSATRARRTSSPATSSAAATDFTASAGRAFRTGVLTRLRARLSVRLARHPVGIAAAGRRTDLRLSRARLRPLHHAFADAVAALYPVRARTRTSRNWPDARIWEELHARLGGTRTLPEGPDAAEGHHADAQLRGRADAVRTAVPRRRFRPHPAADRRQGHEPRLCRRGVPVARHHRRSTAPGAPRSSIATRRPASAGSGRRSASPGG